MKNALAALLACHAALAMADPANPCNAPASAARQSYVDLAATGGGFACAPSPIGQGTLPTLRSNAAGSVAWWHCPAADGTWRTNWAVGTAEVLSGRRLADEISKAVAARDTKAAFAAVTAKNVKLPLSDPRLAAVWCPFAGEMLASAPKAASAVAPKALLSPGTVALPR